MIETVSRELTKLKTAGVIRSVSPDQSTRSIAGAGERCMQAGGLTIVAT